MNELQIFDNQDFGKVRTLEEGENILFCASDVAKALGYKNPTEAIQDHCKRVVERCTSDSLGRRQTMKFIPGGDIYRLAASSKLPGAEKFESWIFDEVVPTIHKHGAYMTPEALEKVLLSPDTLMQLAQNLKDEQEKRRALEHKVEKDKPKVLFADAVSVSDSAILISDLAKILRQNGVEMGQTRLFQWLRENGYLIKQRGSSYNMPTQKAMELGLFKIKETCVTHSDGHTTLNRTPKVTGKGQVYLLNKILDRKVEQTTL